MTFPNGISLLDNFNRADAEPPSANWSSLFEGGGIHFAIVSNQAKNTHFGDSSGDYWNAATFGPDCSAYYTIATSAGTNAEFVDLFLRGSSMGANGTAYMLRCNWDGGGNDQFQLWKWVAGSPTQLGATQSYGGGHFPNGTLIGFECIGTTLTGYYKLAAGSWTQLIQVTDATIAGAGNTGLMIHKSNWVLDDFFAGTNVSVSAPVADFTGTPLSIFTGQSVAFSDASTNTPTSWAWQKDDGAGGAYSNFAGTPTVQNPTETFSVAGTYAIKMTATNAGGSDTKTRTAYVTVTSGGGGGSYNPLFWARYLSNRA